MESRFAETHAKLRQTEYIHWYKSKVGDSLRIPWSRITALALDSMLGREFEARGDYARVSTEQVCGLWSVGLWSGVGPR